MYGIANLIHGQGITTIHSRRTMKDAREIAFIMAEEQADPERSFGLEDFNRQINEKSCYESDGLTISIHKLRNKNDL